MIIAHRQSDLIHKATASKENSANLFNKTIKEFLGNETFEKEKVLDYITYGINLKRLTKGSITDDTIFLSEKTPTIFYLLNGVTKINSKITINKIAQISFDINRGEFLNLNDNLVTKEKKNFVTIIYHSQTFHFIFETSEILKIFIQAIFILTDKENIKELDLVENLRRIWMTYDEDFSGKMEYQEFEKLVKELNIKLSVTDTIEELFKTIDVDKSGFIDFKEFANYYKTFNSGIEFKLIFDEYTENRGFMTAVGLHRFLKFEQGEAVDLKEAEEIMETLKGENRESFNMGVKKDEQQLRISLEEFKRFIYDQNFTTVYDMDKTLSYQDMNRPLHHYFINSSHNTYLSGHQLTSNSDIEMYTYCLLQGYRLVELDCWNGNDETGPVITHGYTLCSSIYLKDVLHAIKKAAFVTSEYPVLLSIENHCKDKQLDMMADYFVNILQDLFVIDPDNLPAEYPILSDLKRKFIVKCKRGRLFRDQGASKILSSDYNIGMESNNNLFNKQNENYKNAKIELKNKIYNDNEVLNFPVVNAEILNPISKRKSMLNLGHPAIKINESKTLVDQYVNKILSANEPTDATGEFLLKQQKSLAVPDNKIIKKKTGLISQGNLAKTVGMIGTKFNIKKFKACNYQPWDCVTVKEEKLLKFSKSIEQKTILMDYCRGSFFKTYPLRINSSNMDPVKTWICGGQIAAINAQSLKDDYTLLNIVFFRMNNNCGYILKPDTLFSGKVIKYKSPYYKIYLEIISGLNLHYLLSNDHPDSRVKPSMALSAYIIGSTLDDEKNKVYELKIEHNFLNPIFKNEAIFTFDVYETFLSFIYFKITINGKLRGRCVIPLSIMSKGIRTVPIYDNKCREIPESLIIVRTSKEVYA